MSAIAYIVQSGPHAHDYGVDWLYWGLRHCDVTVLDIPEKDNLHLDSIEDRDECQIDSDQCWPRREIGRGAHIIDQVLLTSTDTRARMHAQAMVGAPLFAIDMSDSIFDRRGEYEAAAGRTIQPRAYFKRELPIGAKWGTPLPLTYPAQNIDWAWQTLSIVFYHATDHDGGAPGIPRREIVKGLHALVPDDDVTGGDWLDVELYRGQAKGTRPSPEDYHRRMRRASIGISWNGAPNWDCNRFWENFAFGLAQVAERPRIEIPYPFKDGEHCIFVDSPEQVAGAVRWLIDHPERQREIARAGNEHFLKWHSAEKRAGYLLQEMHNICTD